MLHTAMLPVLQYIGTFMLAVVIMLSLLIGAAKVPRSSIQVKMQESSEYLLSQSSLYNIMPSVRGSSIDHYADAVLLSIAYYLEPDDSFRSVMWANYYGIESQDMLHYFSETVTKDVPPNMEYLRYWHGSVVFVRLMHLFLNLKQIYIFHAVLIAALTILLISVLWRGKYKEEAIISGIALSSISIWFVPFCLEYTWVFLVMLVASVIAVNRAIQNKGNWGIFFLITGMITVYLDFLTAETLTLLIPLLLILRIQKDNIKKHYLWWLSVQSCVSWIVGYLGMWITKWVMASVILRIDVLPYVTGHIEERLGGGLGLTQSEFLKAAIIRNLACMSPYGYGIYGAIVILLLIFALVFRPVLMNELQICKRKNVGRIVLFLVLGVVPYVRFLILHNHSVLHNPFTYRAQAATVMALCFVILEFVEHVPRKAVRMNA